MASVRRVDRIRQQFFIFYCIFDELYTTMRSIVALTGKKLRNMRPTCTTLGIPSSPTLDGTPSHCTTRVSYCIILGPFLCRFPSCFVCTRVLRLLTLCPRFCDHHACMAMAMHSGIDVHACMHGYTPATRYSSNHPRVSLSTRGLPRWMSR